MATKKTKGKQKIEMKKIEKLEDRQIRFSKRRSGIYKKASELTTLCGADVGFLAFSTSGKPLTFGHPSFEEVAKCFLAQKSGHPNQSTTHPLVEASLKRRIDNLSKSYEDLVEELEAKKSEAKSLKGKVQYKGWWNTPVEELDLEGVNKTIKLFEDLHERLCNLVIDKTGSASSPLAPLPDLNVSPTSAMMGNASSSLVLLPDLNVSPTSAMDNGNKASPLLPVDGNDDESTDKRPQNFI